MAKKGKSKSIGFFGAIGSLLGCIPAVRNVKKAIGKVFTKARKLKNGLSKRKLAKKFKRAAKKAVLTAKKAAVKKATKKASNASKAAVKQVKKYEKAQNLKLVSMGLNCIPVFGNVKALYEMGTGKDLITGQAKQTGKKIVDEAELEKYLKERQSVSNGDRNSVHAGEPITTLKDLQSVVGAGHHTLPQNKPTIVERFIFSLLFEDIVTLIDPKSTTGERVLAGLSMLPTSKPFKALDAGYDTVKYYKKTTNIIEDSKKTHTGNNKKNDVPNNNNIPNSNSKIDEKTPKVEVTEKDLKELGEYIKKIDKGTGKDFKNYSAKEIERKFDLKKGEFHQVKQDIVKDLTNKNSPYKDSMKKVGNNPDIHLSSDGTIRVMSRDGKTSFDTNWNINDFLP
ncbi:hypothetical protein ABH966_003628 [Lysinibacillus sp. RC46]|uniref:pre-toxin TG domain-containing protein n=1 Tax=Lysinibacillus sp. RC46 TaxID=3156295 RepID=UPI003517E59F